MLKLELSESKRRPYVRFLINDKPMLCLVDTGAEIPVCNAGVKLFKDLFPDALLCARDFKISGYGGDGTLHDVYKIPVMKISDGQNDIKMYNVLCALSEANETGSRFIISANMFGMFDYTISNSTRQLEIRCARDEYYMTVTYDGSVTVFEQNADNRGLLNIAKNLGSI